MSITIALDAGNAAAAGIPFTAQRSRRDALVKFYRGEVGISQAFLFVEVTDIFELFALKTLGAWLRTVIVRTLGFADLAGGRNALFTIHIDLALFTDAAGREHCRGKTFDRLKSFGGVTTTTGAVRFVTRAIGSDGIDASGQFSVAGGALIRQAVTVASASLGTLRIDADKTGAAIGVELAVLAEVDGVAFVSVVGIGHFDVGDVLIVLQIAGVGVPPVTLSVA